MSVKRYDFVIDIGVNCSIKKADVEVSGDGLYVTYHDYELLQSQNAELAVQLANAESKCRELAAENAGLKIQITGCHRVTTVTKRLRLQRKMEQLKTNP